MSALGQTFRRWFSFSEEERRAQAPTPRRPIIETKDSSPNRLVLVVDDDELSRLTARRLIERSGFRCHQARDGHEAIALAENHLYGVILMDIAMPGLDGYQTTKIIHQQARNRETPIIAVTACFSRRSYSYEECLCEGLTDVVSKPIRGSDVIEMLEEWCQKRHIATVQTE